jgi:hypothetical protein
MAMIGAGVATAGNRGCGTELGRQREGNELHSKLETPLMEQDESKTRSNEVRGETVGMGRQLR